MTEDQTMADFVDLIKYIKTKHNAEDKAVIAFGGLYSGMLAAWSRMEYPHVFQGALASSAPVLYFANSTSAPEWKFAEIISKKFASQLKIEIPNHKCYTAIKKGFTQLANDGANTTL